MSRRAALLLLLGSLDLPRALAAQGRELHWPSVSVTAHLDADGRLRVAERQVMRFTGDWNGGERSWNMRFGQELALHEISRLDPATGAMRPLVAGDLDQVDEFAWADGYVLRWRSRMPADPPFNGTEITYLIDATFSNILVPQPDSTYLLDHDFAFSDRIGPINVYELELTLDPAWQAPPSFTGKWRATDLLGGRGYVVSIPLRYGGAGRPAAVLVGASRPFRSSLRLALVGAILLVVILLIRREWALGRFRALAEPRSLTKQWLEANVFADLPEVVGAAWDDQTAAPEVAATLARLVMEKKLSSEVKVEQAWIFTSEILHLKLEVPRSDLQGHERTLVDALFEPHRETTDTKSVRARYKATGFDPAALISARLANLVELTTPGAKGTKPSKLFTLALIAGAAGLAGVGAFRRPTDMVPLLVVTGISLPLYLFAASFAHVWSRRVTGFLLPGVFALVPVIGGLGVFARYLLDQDRFRAGPVVLAGLALWITALIVSLGNIARSRQSAERVARRKRLTAARELFRLELAKPEPALRDEWFPYLIAFGLGPNMDRWFRAFGGAAERTANGFAPTSSRGSSSAGGDSSWTGFGGGGGFSGAGSSASFAAAVGGIAASISAPSSGSSGGSGGGGGGGSSGGGGGGGW